MERYRYIFSAKKQFTLRLNNKVIIRVKHFTSISMCSKCLHFLIVPSASLSLPTRRCFSIRTEPWGLGPEDNKRIQLTRNVTGWHRCDVECIHKVTVSIDPICLKPTDGTCFDTLLRSVHWHFARLHYMLTTQPGRALTRLIYNIHKRRVYFARQKKKHIKLIDYFSSLLNINLCKHLNRRIMCLIK